LNWKERERKRDRETETKQMGLRKSALLITYYPMSAAMKKLATKW